ncbi:4'-phosphopantetheinyl transferase family protein [Variovorax sp. ZT4R33]|uniref:4'-phosphopantetheinyl transferase family protein n=1 Tax=Variovorax sp. ZT4R33 TaxID=3443743 RepID=UPI003F48962A
MSITVLIANDFVLPAPLEAAWLADLPPPRRAQIARWPSVRARHRSLLASRLLCEGLRQLGHRGALLASLRYTVHGRPSLDLPVDFSVSHCEGRVVCALSTQGPVGVDVEALGGLTADDFRLYLNPDERTWAGRDPRRFYTVWTRKEAVAKAGGTERLSDLRAVDVRTGGDGAAFAGQVWQTPELDVGRGHVAHLALRGGDAPWRAVRVSRAQLERGVPSRGGEPGPQCL